MRGFGRLAPFVAGALGVVLIGLGIVYLAMACQDLPGFMGPSPGDTSPRTPLGIGVLLVGLIALGGAVVVMRARRSAG